MKILDFTILAYEGPILRAYLSVIKNLGYKVKRVIKIFNEHKKLGWMPTFFRDPLLFTLTSLRNNYWPVKFLTNKKLSAQMLNPIMIKLYGFDFDFFNAFEHVCFDFSTVADDIIYLDWYGTGCENEKFFSLLKSLGKQTYLFTGGRIMPKSILDLPNTEFVHIHPGYLPYIRGADCILWSILLREHPGATCFYMNSKLDTGNIILAEEYESLHFDKMPNTNLKNLYRLVMSFYDPAVRALCLKHVLEKFGTISYLPSEPQDINKGVTFHFMHDILKKNVLSKIFSK